MKGNMKGNMKKPAPKIDLERGDMKPDWRSNIWPFFIMLAMLWVWQAAVSQLTVRTIPYSEFRAHLARHEVMNAVVRQNEIFGRIVPRAAPATNIAAPLPAVAQMNVRAADTNTPAVETAPSKQGRMV